MPLQLHICSLEMTRGCVRGLCRLDCYLLRPGKTLSVQHLAVSRCTCCDIQRLSFATVNSLKAAAATPLADTKMASEASNSIKVRALELGVSALRHMLRWLVQRC